MPRSAPLPCRHPGCAALVQQPGYCAQHERDVRQWDSPQRARQRREQRGLSTNTARWQRLRELVLREEPLCRICQQQGRTRLARVVDHIDANTSNNGRDNLQPLCPSCHARKTARYDGGFGNPRRRFRQESGGI